VPNSDLDKNQLLEIKDKIIKLRQVFAQRKEELIKMSSDAIIKHNQINRYIKNTNYKNLD
jgi:hypothetical protein